VPVHVIQRGVNRSACFSGPGDHHHYLSLLEEMADRYSCSVHAYVLMTNHVHMLITPAEGDGVSRLMKHLGQRYVQDFNRANGRSGTLWEGRFKSSIVDSERYLICCQRYIELNPVRAGMVARAADYPWSSFRSNALGEPSTLLKRHPLFEAMGNGPEECSARYHQLFGAPDDEELTAIREAVRGGFALGRPGFLLDLEQRLDARTARRQPGRKRLESGRKR
jgi:REP-associated tyrosine transposase